MKRKKTLSDYLNPDTIFDIWNTVGMIILLFVFAWPLWFIVIASVSDPLAVRRGEVLFWFKGFNIDAYKAILQYKDVWTGYRNTIIYTGAGTLVNMFLSVMAAYPLSRKDFKAKKFFNGIFLFTMYFGGGMIPHYLVMQAIGLVNNPMIMILDGAISFYNVIIIRTYFQTAIPSDLQEAAEIDGASPMKYLLKVVLPLSKPVLSVVALYYAVGHWNSYFPALKFLYKRELYPLQMVQL